MSNHDPEVTIRQILSYAEEAVELSHGKTRHDLEQDRLVNLALARLLEL